MGEVHALPARPQELLADRLDEARVGGVPCVVGSWSNDARMTRWPLSFTASLLHHYGT